MQLLGRVGAGHVLEESQESQEFLVPVPVLAQAGGCAGGDLNAANRVVVPCRT